MLGYMVLVTGFMGVIVLGYVVHCYEDFPVSLFRVGCCFFVIHIFFRFGASLALCCCLCCSWESICLICSSKTVSS